jgi:hypothetical protein
MAQTDNTYLADKVALRVAHLPQKDTINVLDCFGGSGKVWKAVKRLTGKNIRVLPIEMKDINWFHLPGDNMKYLGSIALEKYDIVDLDAYGIPYEQLKEVFDRGFNGIVFVTFIQSIFGGINHDMLIDIGFTKEQIKKIPTIFGKRGWEYFLEWLGLHGVKKIWHRHHARKHYLGFSCAGESSSGSRTRQEDRAEDHA